MVPVSCILRAVLDDDEQSDEPDDETGVPISFDQKVALHTGELAQDTPPDVVDIMIYHPESGAQEAPSPHSSHSDDDVDVGT